MGWLVAPAALTATVLAAALVATQPLHLFGPALAVGAVLALGWIAVSALWPGKADRSCPACGADALERLDARSTRGVRCAACGHADDAASAFALTEEEGTFEDVVLRERGRLRGPDAS